MNLIKSKNAHDMRRGGCRPPFRNPPACTFSGGGTPKSDQILSSALKVVPGPSEAFLVTFWTDGKPYKCIGSKWRL